MKALLHLLLAVALAVPLEKIIEPFGPEITRVFDQGPFPDLGHQWDPNLAEGEDIHVSQAQDMAIE